MIIKKTSWHYKLLFALEHRIIDDLNPTICAYISAVMLSLIIVLVAILSIAGVSMTLLIRAIHGDILCRFILGGIIGIGAYAVLRNFIIKHKICTFINYE